MTATTTVVVAVEEALAVNIPEEIQEQDGLMIRMEFNHRRARHWGTTNVMTVRRLFCYKHFESLQVIEIF